MSSLFNSHKNSRKARGYIFEENGKLIYYCHNCGISLSLISFLKQINPELYRSFCFEAFKTEDKFNYFIENKISKKPKFVDFDIFSNLKKISELSDTTSFKQFIIKRKIPSDYYCKLFACPNFMEWTNTIKPNSFSLKSLKFDEPRIIIPFIDKQKNIIAFQGRSLQSSNNPKYLTITLNEGVPNIFGFDSLNINELVYVLEGPIDSMFIANSIAVAGSNLSIINKILPKDQIVLIFDNEKRNKEIVKKMEQVINNNHKIVIWPSTFYYKDINDAIINEITIDSILNTIVKNTFTELTAKLKFNEWRK